MALLLKRSINVRRFSVERPPHPDGIRRRRDRIAADEFAPAEELLGCRRFRRRREVEEAIYRLPGVSEVAVIGVPHPHWVEAVVAVVVPKAGAALDQSQVLEHAHRILASFKVPKRVVFADSLPKNPSGKILKRELREEHVKAFG